MAENETKNIDENQENFNELVEIAEKYIKDNACDILNAIRGTKYSKDAKDCCYNLIHDYYKPMYEINEESQNDEDFLKANKNSKYYEKNATTLEEKLLVRFCIQQQNYQAMPKAINYDSYIHRNIHSNDIFNIAKNYLNSNVNVDYCNLYNSFFDKFEFEQNKEFEDYEKSELNGKIKVEEIKSERKNGKTKYMYNYAWLKYSEGLSTCINYLNGKNNLKEIIKNVNKNKITKKKLKEDFYYQIKYMAETLTYDFFKEIGCRNLLKDDVHIVAIYKKVFNKNDNNTKIVENILKWYKAYCDEYNKDKDKEKHKDTYYIDKILWLCCTGAFYEDDIIITTMNRKNFFEYYDAKIKNKK